MQRRSRRLATQGRGFQGGPVRRRRAPRRVQSIVPRPLQGRYQYNVPDFEKKFLDTDIGADIGQIADTLDKSNLNVIVQGDGESERLGRKVTVRNIYCQGSLTLVPATAAATTSTRVKLMVIVDTQTNKATFATAAFLESDAIDSYRNLAYQTRFKVLWSRTYTFNVSGAAPSGAAYIFGEGKKNFRMGKKCNIPIEFDNSAETGAVGTQTVNSIHLVAIAEDNNIVTLAGTARIRYTDK